jgi:hypothetical protein
MRSAESLEKLGFEFAVAAFLIHWLLVRVQDGPLTNSRSLSRSAGAYLNRPVLARANYLGELARALLRLVDSVAAENSPYDPCLVQLGDRSFEDISIQHDEVSEFAFLD